MLGLDNSTSIYDSSNCMQIPISLSIYNEVCSEIFPKVLGELLSQPIIIPKSKSNV